MSTLAKLNHVFRDFEENEYIVTQSHSADDCNEYEIFDKNLVKKCYIVEFFVNPITTEVLQNAVFEVYSENENTTNDYENDDFLCSTVHDDFEEVENELFDIFES